MCLVRHLADRCQSRAAMGGERRSNGKPYDTVQKRGGNIQLCRRGEFPGRGCDRTAVSVSTAVQVEVGSRYCVVTRQVGELATKAA